MPHAGARFRRDQQQARNRLLRIKKGVSVPRTKKSQKRRRCGQFRRGHTCRARPAAAGDERGGLELRSEPRAGPTAAAAYTPALPGDELGGPSCCSATRAVACACAFGARARWPRRRCRHRCRRGVARARMLLMSTMRWRRGRRRPRARPFRPPEPSTNRGSTGEERARVLKASRPIRPLMESSPWQADAYAPPLTRNGGHRAPAVAHWLKRPERLAGLIKGCPSIPVRANADGPVDGASQPVRMRDEPMALDRDGDARRERERRMRPVRAALCLARVSDVESTSSVVRAGARPSPTRRCSGSSGAGQKTPEATISRPGPGRHSHPSRDVPWSRTSPPYAATADPPRAGLRGRPRRDWWEVRGD